MKICIPTADDAGLEATLAGSFGRAPFFTIVDTETNALRSLSNPECRGGEGACHHVGLLRRHGVDAVTCTGVGRRALAGLRAAGLEVFAADGGTVAQALAAARAGTAEPLHAEQACGGGHRHGRESGCGSGESSGHRHEHRHGHRHEQRSR